MSSVRNQRRERQKNKEEPVNITCGKCRKVIPYTEDHKCPYCDVKEED